MKGRINKHQDMKMNVIIKKGDRVRIYGPEGIRLGTVESIAPSGETTIIPDGQKEPIYLFHNAIEGFDLLDETPHPWSPISMARIRMMRFSN